MAVSKEERSVLISREARNVTVMSAAHFFIFATTYAIQNLQSSLNEAEGLGIASLACVYSGFIVSSVISPLFIRFLGPKRTLLAAFSTYLIYSAANIYPTWPSLIVASIFNGLGIGLSSNAYPTYIIYQANCLVSKTGETLHSAISRFDGMFTGFSITAAQVFGNLISSFILSQRNGKDIKLDVLNSTVNETSTSRNLVVNSSLNATSIRYLSHASLVQGSPTCGAHNCPWNEGNPLQPTVQRPSSHLIYLLFGIFCALDILGMILLLFMERIPKSDATKTCSRPNIDEEKCLCESPNKQIVEKQPKDSSKSPNNLLDQPNVLYKQSKNSHKDIELINVSEHPTNLSENLVNNHCDNSVTDKDNEMNDSNNLTDNGMPPSTCSVIGQMVLSCARLNIHEGKLILLVPMFICQPMIDSVLYADFTKWYLSCTMGVGMVGYTMTANGVASCVFSVTMGWLARYTGRVAQIIAMATIQMGILIGLYYWRPTQDDYYVFFVVAGVWGIGVVWLTQGNALMALAFPNDQQAAFANFYSWRALGFTLAFALSKFLCVSTKLLIIGGTHIVSVVLYVGVEIMVGKEERTRDYEIDIDDNVDKLLPNT